MPMTPRTGRPCRIWWSFPGRRRRWRRLCGWRNEHRFPVVPRGAGTGRSGGSVPIEGGVVIVLTRLNRILEISRPDLVAVVEPGVILSRLKQAVEAEGLYYPPDPASADFCTIGGNVAECAGGAVAVQYGVTRDYVLGLEVVLPTGEIISAGTRTMKGVVGYDLTRLFLGSEGTLGVITGITLRLVAKPAARQTLAAGFATHERRGRGGEPDPEIGPGAHGPGVHGPRDAGLRQGAAAL